jgi:hypothetical protein
MRVHPFLSARFEDEDGAVTVDWVVLTAAIVTLGVGALSIISPSLTAGAEQISGVVETAMTASTEQTSNGTSS